MISVAFSKGCWHQTEMRNVLLQYDLSENGLDYAIHTFSVCLAADLACPIGPMLAHASKLYAQAWYFVKTHLLI